ncbi:hypothetical protein [Thiorhodococcus minor]|uniref:Uncharacterized protein n=1 Tax=Thiorhodococcus minor TaxID=57489 RepID=A0A6M0K426_9GAMM|nr:hypothetical protein [Thiorhodococcus minor]NEV63673.1 hypothetical protein [Thiorhodococcus minor]
MLRDLPWSFYLASSWLWCIGAFFPLILARDYGGIALLPFTLLNVLGAAWFGFHFRKKHSDARFRQRQGGAPRLFSQVTILYQIAFVVWLSAVLGQPWLIVVMLGLVLGFYSAKRALHWVSIGVFAVSIGLFWLQARSGLRLPALDAQDSWPQLILPLALGFLLSPYLDLTFHRAYGASRNPRFTFALGFGVLFLALLLFVFAYAETLAGLFFAGEANAALLAPVIGFILLQTAFTAAAHAREVAAAPTAGGLVRAVWPIAAAFLLLGPALYFWQGAAVPVIDVSVGEVVYKGFLLMYGLVFPLRVLFLDQPRRFWAVLGLATPLYSLGFLLGGPWSLGLGAAMLVVLAGLMARRTLPEAAPG